MICVTVGRTRHRMVTAQHQELADQGAELVELRLDWISRLPDLDRLLKVRPTPIIVTCRRPVDGGRWRASEEQRLTILRQAIVAGVDYIDLEVDIAKKIRRYGKTKRIVSFHDFTGTPDDLDDIYKKIAECDPDIIKIVTTATSPTDNVHLLRLVKNADRPTVGFCMGDYGVVSRVLCGKFGSPFTYATFSKERVLAPGQLSFEDMKHLYRYDQINAETKIFGVLGDPIAHSLSPLIHNTAFREQGINAVYLPLRVPSDQLLDTLRAYEFLGFSGYSVTIPHKQAVMEYAQFVNEASKRIGASNTLFKNARGEWCAANTDYDAGLSSILLGLEQKGETSLDGKRVLILGAGGAARAIALAVSKAGAALTITNRSKQRGAELAAEIGCQFVTWENRGAVSSDVLVNCTPVGMFPEMDETPFAENWLREDMVVFDTIYNPENTLLIKHARERGCKVVSGIEMFVRQAAAQFKYFTGMNASLDQMGRTVRRGISPIRIKTDQGHMSPEDLRQQLKDEDQNDGADD